MKYSQVAVLVLLLSFNSFAEEKKESSILGSLVSNYTPSKEETLGKILKGVLENVHLTKHKLDDDISEKAFGLYIERIDYGKQFLLKSDIAELKKFEDEFDNQYSTGQLEIVAKTKKIFDKRLPVVEKFAKDFLAKDIAFDKKEKIETDPDKRDFANSEDELKDRWRKLLKLDVLVQYLEYKEEQEGTNEDKDEKEKKKVTKKAEKKLSEKELLAKARGKVAKRYEKIFKRMKEEENSIKQDKFYNAVARVYDPHTLYLLPEEKEDFDIDISGKLEGIGALLREEGSYIKVERIIPGSASWKGKELAAEDIVLGVAQGKDGEIIDIVDMSIRDAVKMIRGPKGTVVRLKVKKPDGHIKMIDITRDKVVIEESYVKATILTHKKLKHKFGYIYVPKFYRDFQDRNGRNCSDDVKKELIKFAKKGVEGVILDLRNNGGGALEDARLMGGLFIDKGPIVQVKNSGAPKIQEDTDGKTYWDKPLIVMVNRFSASASEIVAGALKDYKRALVIGSSEQTHGKGTVQTVLDLNSFLNPVLSKMMGDFGAMKITTDMFYRINGMSTQFRGIVPDIILPDEFAYLESGERTLDHAIPYKEIPALKYKKWTKAKYDVQKLKEKSMSRVKQSEGFKKIEESVAWYKKRKELTQRSLDITEMKQFREESLKMSKKFKNDKVETELVVEKYKELKTEEDKERFKEFQEGLQKDVVLSETLLIFNDLLEQS